jgi:hypothetical protein
MKMKLIDLDKLAPAYAAGQKAAELLLDELELRGKPGSRENLDKLLNALAYTCFAVLANNSPNPAGDAKAFGKQLPTMVTHMLALFHRGPRH